MFGLKVVSKDLYQIDMDLLDTYKRLHECDEQVIEAQKSLINAADDYIKALKMSLEWYRDRRVPIRYFCRECGKEIFEGLPDIAKQITTIAEIEADCVCSDCIMQEHKEDYGAEDDKD